MKALKLNNSFSAASLQSTPDDEYAPNREYKMAALGYKKAWISTNATNQDRAHLNNSTDAQKLEYLAEKHHRFIKHLHDELTWSWPNSGKLMTRQQTAALLYYLDDVKNMETKSNNKNLAYFYSKIQSHADQHRLVYTMPAEHKEFYKLYQRQGNPLLTSRTVRLFTAAALAVALVTCQQKARAEPTGHMESVYALARQ